MPESAKGAARTTGGVKSRFAPHSVLREPDKSAKGAARTTGGGRAVSRRTPFCASPIKAQRVRRAPPGGARAVSRRTPFCASPIKAQRMRRAPPGGGKSRFAPRSVLREPDKSAKAAARTTGGVRSRFAPHSVLRESDKTWKTLRVPASSANLGPGFDALGLALDLYLESRFRTAAALEIRVHGRDSALISPGEDNLIWQTALRVAADAGRAMPPIELEIDNDIPLGKGLGRARRR